MELNEKIRKKVQEILKEICEEVQSPIEEEVIDEERITHADALDNVKKMENFLSSHTYGEDLGDMGEMYVVYSYGEQHPIYLYTKGIWYHNSDDYVKIDGEINMPTRKHMINLRPTNGTIGKPKSWMKRVARQFKRKHGLGPNSHADEFPGEDK